MDRRTDWEKSGKAAVRGKDEKKVDEILTEFHVTGDNPDKREECRKIVLCWQYMPAIVKAIIQTKRRSLKLDQNSKKFD